MYTVIKDLWNNELNILSFNNIFGGFQNDQKSTFYPQNTISYLTYGTNNIIFFTKMQDEILDHIFIYVLWVVDQNHGLK